MFVFFLNKEHFLINEWVVVEFVQAKPSLTFVNDFVRELNVNFRFI